MNFCTFLLGPSADFYQIQHMALLLSTTVLLILICFSAQITNGPKYISWNTLPKDMLYFMQYICIKFTYFEKITTVCIKCRLNWCIAYCCCIE
jgi:hypothetical protein